MSTQPIAKPLARLDNGQMAEAGEVEAALGAYLAGRVPGFSGLRRMIKFASGQSNPTWKIEADSGTYVLRAKPPGALLASAHQVEREFRVMAALECTEVPVPRVFYLDAGDGPLGRAFYVMEYREGRIFWDPALPEVPRAGRAALYDAMNRVLAAVHGVDVAAIGLTDFGKPGNYFARQTDRWTRQYHAAVETPDPAVEDIIAWLSAHIPPDDGTVALVHGDFRLDNMVFHPTEPRVIGLLDWELSTLGHPLADLAYQCMQWRLPHDVGMRGLGGLDRAALGLPDEAAYVDAYAARRGLDRIDHWDAALVFSYFRLIAILEGVVRRAAEGNASNPEAAMAYKGAIPHLVRQAHDMVRNAA